MKQNILIGIFAVIVVVILVGAAGIALTISPTTTTVNISTTATVSNTATVSTTATVSNTITHTVTAPTTRVITDMTGRNLTVPVDIKRVLTTSPPIMELVYMLDPSALAGLTFSYDGAPTAGEALPPLVPANMTGLPVVGGWYGTTTGNFETFIGQRPDIIIDSQLGTTSVGVATMVQNFAPIPVVELNSDYAQNMSTYTAAITFVGNLLGVAIQAQSLQNYFNTAMNYVNNITSKIPVSQRVTVYYAEGSNGLSTDPAGSMHTDLLTVCGGINVAQVQLLPGYGMASVSPEQILQWNPQMIIIGRGSQASLYKTVTSNTTWSSINAVKNGQVFVRPDNPFSWFDGPPGPTQIIGLYWMVHLLYPTQTTGLNLSAQVQTFYLQYMHYNLNSTQSPHFWLADQALLPSRSAGSLNGAIGDVW